MEKPNQWFLLRKTRSDGPGEMALRGFAAGL
jgi:hypothetical protein